MYIDTSWMRVKFFNIQTCILYKVNSCFVNKFYKVLSFDEVFTRGIYHLNLSTKSNFPFHTPCAYYFFLIFYPQVLSTTFSHKQCLWTTASCIIQVFVDKFHKLLKNLIFFVTLFVLYFVEN